MSNCRARAPNGLYSRWRRASALTSVGIAVLASWWLSANAADTCTTPIARIVSIQGSVELGHPAPNGFQNVSWHLATLNATLCAGDMIRVHQRSRAALFLSNETTLRLDQATTLTLIGPDEKRSSLQLLRGALHVITRTQRPLKVTTPFINANVEGTEFLVVVEADKARVAVYEGRVIADNEQGSIVLTSGELAVAERNVAPRKELLVRPRDAVQWTLYYPTIFDYRLDTAVTAAPGESALRESIELYRQGKLAEALARVENVPEGLGNSLFLTYRAGLVLLVGRLDEAEADIERALSVDPRNSDAYALMAVIAVVQNDKDQMLSLATKAVDLDPNSPPARIALSYAQQAQFKIEEARETVQKALDLDPKNALAWARLAELHMSIGDLDRALVAAKRAVELNPDLAKTQTVLGFANLTRIDTRSAKAAFQTAIELDQADPLPRLGLGLAKIRNGDLQGGREEIEIATILDPGNSLTRSYLGKLYYEEKRDKLAGAQFDLAKELDAKDPTPWFYDALLKQASNQPVEALQDLQKSIELNDNRAVYRSRLLLDQDSAARSASLARVYNDLGSGALAVIEASKSLEANPGNYSAHRFLSEAYAEIDRHEIARVSELLQAQILQPLNVTPIQPRLAFADVSILSRPPLAEAAFNEYALLFERDGSHVSVAAQAGNHGTWGDEVVVSRLSDKLSLSIGQFHYETAGFRSNNDFKHDIYDAFAQFAVTPSFSIQAEIRKRRTRHGDLSSNFDPNTFLVDNRFDIDQEASRVGMAYSPSPHMRLIGSFMSNKREEHQTALESGIDIRLNGESPGRQAEVQYQGLYDAFNVTVGFGSSRVKLDTQSSVTDLVGVLGGDCAPIQPCEGESVSRVKQYNAYLYANLFAHSNFNALIGLGRETYDDGALELRLWNPKLGLRWRLTDWLSLRAATFKTLKRVLIVDQTIEPTQVVGFNQFFDDPNGTKTKTVAVATDLRLSASLQGTIEGSRRELLLGPSLVGADLNTAPFEQWKERKLGGGLLWTPNPRMAITLGGKFEDFERVPLVVDEVQPISVKTVTIPAGVRNFWGDHFTSELTATAVRQRVRRLDGLPPGSGEDSFVLLDAVLIYRLPSRLGALTLAVNNLLNKRFSFQDDNFRSSEIRPPRYIPSRRVALTASLAF